MTLKFTILGCGNSSGVPAIGNYWGDCNPNEPKNRRYRCCFSVQSENTTLVIDTGADFRMQMNHFNINELSAILYTHQHSDHTHGIDDIRSFYFRNGKYPIKCYGKSSVLRDIAGRFTYIFDGGENSEMYPPIMQACPFDESDYGRTQTINDISFIPFKMDHGTCTSVGYRFSDISYCVDMRSLDQTALDVIKGSKVWIVDGAGYLYDENPAHAHLERLYEYNRYIQAETVYVTCLSTLMDYQTLVDTLPQGFHPAYDGLVL